MQKSVDRKRNSLSAVSTVLILSCAGCPGWLREPLTHPSPTTPPPPAAGGSAGAGSSAGDPSKPLLPKHPGSCPKLATGTVQIHGGLNVRVWVGDEQPNHAAPLVVYWHGTGSSPSEAEFMLGDTFDTILAEGGIVAAPAATTGEGENTSTGVWSTGDFAIADDLVACAVEQRNIDVHRIYTAGCSAGAIEAGYLAYARSNYIAGAMMNSGGLVNPIKLQDPARVPAAITAHGAKDADVVIIDFSEASIAYGKQLVGDGGFAVDCDHGGGHCAAPAALVKAQWEFLNAHPYGVSPEPYANGLPASFPTYCKAIQ